MSSTIIREARWLFLNVAILLAWLFAIGLAQAAVRLAISANGSIGDGWGGNPVQQALGWATMTVWFAAIYSILIVLVLIPYRLVVRVVGHPRAIAVLLASALTLIAVSRVEGIQPEWIAFLAIFGVGYALLFRLPGQDPGDLPPLVRGGLVGFAMSCVWLIGSLVAIGWAGYKVSIGARREAGAILIAGTAVPGVMLFLDLFRADVPGDNFAITAVLLGAAVAGAVLIGRALQSRGAATG